MAPNPSTSFSIKNLTFFFQSRRAGFEADLVSHLVAYINGAKQSLDVAIYDLRQPDVLSALAQAVTKGHKLRIAYHGAEQATVKAIQDHHLTSHATAVHPTGNHLMHNKFIVRDGNSVWTGSANFTPGGLQLQDNNCLIADWPALAAQYEADFMQLITPQTFHISTTAVKPVKAGVVSLSAYFSSSGGASLEQAVVDALHGAKRVRVLAFLISDPETLTALQAFSKASFDIRGVLDPHGMKDALGKKKPDPKLYWFLKDKRFKQAPSHAFNPGPGAEQDFMHNKVMIIDDRLVITGSYNFSENAEANDENMLVIDSPAVAAAYSTYFDALYAVKGNK